MPVDLANKMTLMITLRGPSGFQCAWGFKGRFEEPAPLPLCKEAFLLVIAEGIDSADLIRAGFQAYQQALNSNKTQGFSPRFLASENVSIAVTQHQLDKIKIYLEAIREEIGRSSCADTFVDDETVHDAMYCLSWIARCRAILVHSHVYYKVNYTLVGSENKDITMASKS
ncbi:hypothetical protein PV10_03264 [Exophiala mesophila]|uniref:Uncharacterized protein n=1 Tax=Exophiala mesophila TaxID=212818 RepID=A0A0D1X1J5_EXOME|nr:uncharacterized protein PV10_03264 [Exophiala mesophila]KIV95635.1 hypothetical protein PV10_03264 [Exophiala mesophila]